MVVSSTYIAGWQSLLGNGMSVVKIFPWRTPTLIGIVRDYFPSIFICRDLLLIKLVIVLVKWFRVPILRSLYVGALCHTMSKALEMSDYFRSKFVIDKVYQSGMWCMVMCLAMNPNCSSRKVLFSRRRLLIWPRMACSAILLRLNRRLMSL